MHVNNNATPLRRAQAASVWLRDNASELRNIIGPYDGGDRPFNIASASTAVCKILENTRDLVDYLSNHPDLMSDGVHAWDETRVRAARRRAGFTKLIKLVSNLHGRMGGGEQDT